MQPKPARPTGVTILGVLAVLGGIGFLFFGIILTGLGLLVGTLASEAVNAQLAAAGYPGLTALGSGVIAMFLLVIGAIFLVLGVLYFMVGVGFFGGKGWSWSLGMIVSIIGIIISIVQIAFGGINNILGLIIGLVIVYYLTRPHVKNFFGKGTPTSASPGMSQM